MKNKEYLEQDKIFQQYRCFKLKLKYIKSEITRCRITDALLQIKPDKSSNVNELYDKLNILEQKLNDWLEQEVEE